MLPAYHIWFLFYGAFGPKAATSRSLASHGRPVEVASRWFELDASSGCLPAQSAWAAEGGASTAVARIMLREIMPR